MHQLKTECVVWRWRSFWEHIASIWSLNTFELRRIYCPLETLWYAHSCRHVWRTERCWVSSCIAYYLIYLRSGSPSDPGVNLLFRLDSQWAWGGQLSPLSFSPVLILQTYLIWVLRRWTQVFLLAQPVFSLTEPFPQSLTGYFESLAVIGGCLRCPRVAKPKDSQVSNLIKVTLHL